MKTYQYRVWDVENREYIDNWVFLKPDGYLYTPVQDDAEELLRPKWFEKEEVKRYQALPKENWYKDYYAIKEKIEAEIKTHQHEWFIVECATGYVDRHGKMIFDGDIVHDTGEIGADDNGYYHTCWGEFSDCCVEGETWIFGNFWQPTVMTNAKDTEIVGNIHQHEHLLKQKAVQK